MPGDFSMRAAGLHYMGRLTARLQAASFPEAYRFDRVTLVTLLDRAQTLESVISRFL